jgi:hypothetical protein
MKSSSKFNYKCHKIDELTLMSFKWNVDRQVYFINRYSNSIKLQTRNLKLIKFSQISRNVEYQDFVFDILMIRKIRIWSYIFLKIKNR